MVRLPNNTSTDTCCVYCAHAGPNRVFKRLVKSSAAWIRASKDALFILVEPMNLFVYSDESGVFDYKHCTFYAYGGLILTSEKAVYHATHKYCAVEKIIREQYGFTEDVELKASNLSPKIRYRIFRSINYGYRFGCIIRESYVHRAIFADKKSKQRYLDYAYKIAVKRAFERLIDEKTIIAEDINSIRFFVDEHATATNGCYELEESLEREFKYGTTNYNYNMHYPPIFPAMSKVSMKFCDSKSQPLIRASDIIANRIWHLENDGERARDMKNTIVTYLP